jgi:hypothetical protein
VKGLAAQCYAQTAGFSPTGFFGSTENKKTGSQDPVFFGLNLIE